MNTALLPKLKRTILEMLDVIDDMDLGDENEPLRKAISTMYFAAGDVTDHMRDVIAAPPAYRLQSLDEAVAPEEDARVAAFDAAQKPASL